MTTESLLPNSEFQIEGVTESCILSYFTNLNAGEFRETAALFAVDGMMYAPFEEGVRGREAIANYLQQEAQGVKAYPRQGVVEDLPNQLTQVQVTGKAETSWCGVNVLWLFILNPDREIQEARIKLLASPQDLLALRPPSK